MEFFSVYFRPGFYSLYLLLRTSFKANFLNNAATLLTRMRIYDGYCQKRLRQRVKTGRGGLMKIVSREKVKRHSSKVFYPFVL